MVGIAGVPGSGKSTTAHAVCAKINSMRPRLDQHHVAVVVGMDGEVFLLTRIQTVVLVPLCFEKKCHFWHAFRVPLYTCAIG